MNSTRVSKPAPLKDRPKPMRTVAVFRHNQRTNSQPCEFVSRDVARYWSGCGFARWKGDWTIILKEPLPLKLRGPSANIRERTIHAALDGSKFHQSIIQAWA